MRLQGWSWMTPIPTTSNRRRCKKRHIEDTLGFPPTCATVVTRLPGTSRCRPCGHVPDSRNTPAPSSFFGVCRGGVVSGIERQTIGNRANQNRDVRRLCIGNGANTGGRNLAATTPPLIRLPANTRAHLRQPWRGPLGEEASGHGEAPRI